MNRNKVVLVCLVLVGLILLSSCSFNPIDTKIKEIQEKENDMSDMDIQTYTFTDKILMFAGLYEIEPPSGSNPSFIIKNSTGSNMFEFDHDGRGMIKYNLTVGSNLVFNTTMMGGCPRMYVNASGCLITEACSGSRIAVCD